MNYEPVTVVEIIGGGQDPRFKARGEQSGFIGYLYASYCDYGE